MIKRVLGTTLSVCIAVSLFGCKSDSVDTLLGSYGAQQNGKIQPVVKVEKTNAGYVFDDYVNGNWRTGTEVAEPMTKEDFEKLTGAHVSGEFVALKTKAALVAKVPAGFQSGKFKTSTGYMLIFMFGPVELTKL
ncbi:hypothetical protein BTM_1597 [Burkholderia thailandensis 34]|uniref:hypothetical protein n=1 Tax=Burkholderia thailandensis TaxID=57975 RepID=UPI0005D74264|nr:hypothetical protein [Burkholderia thailandensis]AJY30556.1 hypothetical protein BTM_1597 [Burkholderia thailandensis 34]AOJ55450.1 hypothetical protein AQ477_02250 [Burkholderia thailandensis]KXF60548.1 hypothetical protein AQ476_04080 [Burkholderia thailandensis]PNE75396.1 hypothetical protein A8H37_27570 [Burkholderia thailandensis]